MEKLAITCSPKADEMERSLKEYTDQKKRNFLDIFI